MRYSLRSLMIVVTLVCVVLGVVMGRVEYLRRSGMFHEREAARFLKNIQDQNRISPEGARMIAETAADDLQGFVAISDGQRTRHVALERNADTCAFLFHRRMSEEYSAAIYRPWTSIDETMLPKEDPKTPYSTFGARP